jgi:hypothetical protein
MKRVQMRPFSFISNFEKPRSFQTIAAVRKKEKEKMDFVIEKYQLYVREDITRSQYIRCVAYKYFARTYPARNPTIYYIFEISYYILEIYLIHY